MSDTAYRLFGIVVWRALKWYLREQLPSARRVAVALLVTLAALIAAAGLLRRAGG